MVLASKEVLRGQFRNNVLHGQGERRWPNGDRYIGSFSEGEREGDGRFVEAASGDVFSGQWFHGRLYGEGKAELVRFSEESVSARGMGGGGGAFGQKYSDALFR